jgi:predicted phage terminase large subunit-like protein
MLNQKQSKLKKASPPTNDQYREWLRVQAAKSDAAFAEYISDLIFPRHLREMEVFLNKNERALVLMPRGHAKTTMLIHRTARMIGLTKGKIRIGIVTSVLSDALARSRAIKTIIESAEFAEVFPWAKSGVAGGKWTDEVWTIKGVNLGKDATCFADGLTSIKPGPRLDLLIADDIVGLRENATPTQRQKASETYWQVIDPMLVPGATRWYIGTRWHEDDFYAEIESKGIPTYLRRSLEEAGPLWPEMYTTEALEQKREELGTPIFNLQYQNDVTSMGGNIFRYEYFKYVDQVPPGARRIGVDLAASERERSDYTAAVEVLEDEEHNLYVLGAYRTRIQQGHQKWLTGVEKDGTLIDDPSSPRLLWPARFVGLKGQKDVWGEEPRRVTEVNIESVQYQSTFVREMVTETRLPARGVRPERDKVFRSRSLAARYEAGKVFHLKGGPGIRQLESEMMSFPNSEHDDLVDALVYAADVGNSGFYFTSAKR